jgi:toxin ParE1/3/4
MVERKWRVRLGGSAELDFANILKWTTENFGARQACDYRDTLVQAIGELAGGPDVAGSKARDEIIAGLRTLHDTAVADVTSCSTGWRQEG